MEQQKSVIDEIVDLVLPDPPHFYPGFHHLQQGNAMPEGRRLGSSPPSYRFINYQFKRWFTHDQFPLIRAFSDDADIVSKIKYNRGSFEITNPVDYKLYQFRIIEEKMVLSRFVDRDIGNHRIGFSVLIKDGVRTLNELLNNLDSYEVITDHSEAEGQSASSQHFYRLHNGDSPPNVFPELILLKEIRDHTITTAHMIHYLRHFFDSATESQKNTLLRSTQVQMSCVYPISIEDHLRTLSFDAIKTYSLLFIHCKRNAMPEKILKCIVDGYYDYDKRFQYFSLSYWRFKFLRHTRTADKEVKYSKRESSWLMGSFGTFRNHIHQKYLPRTWIRRSFIRRQRDAKFKGRRKDDSKYGPPNDAHYDYFIDSSQRSKIQLFHAEALRDDLLRPPSYASPS